MTQPAVLAQCERSGFIESIHVGHAVIVDAGGEVVRSWGDPATVVFPRSSAKPVQATAMVAAGLELPDAQLALVGASHSGEQVHLDGVRAILAGLDAEEVLQTPPAMPYDTVERDAWIRDERLPTRVAMMCSGKHAGMIVTSLVNGWPVGGYRDPDHPLQRAIVATMAQLAGEDIRGVGVDGCGAPVLAVSLLGLARALASCRAHRAGDRVLTAMAAHPVLVAGTRRDPTALMTALPGVVVKDGAEGVGVAVLPNGTAIAVKVADGAERARQVALARLLALAGLAVPERFGCLAVDGGGRPVGAVSSPLS